jgi:hypothetical protein
MYNFRGERESVKLDYWLVGDGIVAFRLGYLAEELNDTIHLVYLLRLAKERKLTGITVL